MQALAVSRNRSTVYPHALDAARLGIHSDDQGSPGRGYARGWGSRPAAVLHDRNLEGWRRLRRGRRWYSDVAGSHIAILAQQTVLEQRPKRVGV